MKICLLSMNLYIHGGIQRVLPSVLNPLADRHEITILMPFDENKDYNVFGLSERISIVNLHQFPCNRKDTVSGALALSCWKINKKTAIFDNRIGTVCSSRFMFSKKQKDSLIIYFNNEGYDIIIGVTEYYSLLLAMIAPKLKSKTVGWEHNTFESYFEMRGRNSYGLKRLCQQEYRHLDALFVLTNCDKEKFSKFFKVKTWTLYNPVSLKCDEVTANRDKDIIFVGRLYEYQKGLDYLIQIMERVVQKKNDRRIVVIGDGVDRAKFEKKIEERGLQSNMILVGMQDDVDKFYRNASVFLHTSRYEGFGVVIIEAMLYGIPVVAFHNNGPDEIITDSENGILIDQYDVEKFADKVDSLLNDESLYHYLSINASDRAREFLPGKISATFEKLLHEIVEEGRR